MVQSNSPAPKPMAQAPGNAAMNEADRGLILQRGGVEIKVDKVDDRFIVASDHPEELEALAKRHSAAAQESATPNQITEFTVPPQERDQAMKEMRASGEVTYAAHVYQFKDDPTNPIYLSDEITIQFTPNTPSSVINQVAKDSGLQQVKPIQGIPNAFVFTLTKTAQENPLKLTNRLMQRSDVLTAEPNIIVPTQPHYRPKDPIYSTQWHLHHNGGDELAAGSHISAEAAWDVTRGHRSIVVAVMDDAIDLDHTDFQGPGKMVWPKDFKGTDYLPLPEDAGENHGTSCAGVAVAEENGLGGVGVAPGCALMPIRTTGFLDDNTIEELFDWATTHGASVISCSWGPSAVNYPLSLRQKAALTRAASQGRNGKGCVIVFASGNANRPTNGIIRESGWPNNALSGNVKWFSGFSAHPDVIAVSACTSLNRKAAYSNWGPDISVCGPSNNAPPGVGLPNIGFVATPPQVNEFTPGLGIVTTDRSGFDGYSAENYTPDRGDAAFGGTSSACPLVAGVAALVLSANPALTAREVRQILEQTTDKIVDKTPDPQFGIVKGTYEASGRCDWFGYGKVNAAKAVQMAAKKRLAAIASTRNLTFDNTQVLAIPDGDGDGVVSDVQVREAGILRDIQVNVDLTHGYLGDLELWLIPPSGQGILLQGRDLGRRTQINARYSLQSTPVLQQLLGSSIQGRWQLQAIDLVPQDIGQIDRWRLTLGI
jgi:subtilisin family serine protease